MPTPRTGSVTSTASESALARARDAGDGRRATPAPPASTINLSDAYTPPTQPPPQQRGPSRKSVEEAERLAAAMQPVEGQEEPAGSAEPAQSAPPPAARPAATLAPELTPDQQRRRRAEQRMQLPPIDVGQFLMSSGEALQTVPILPGLTVVFRSPRLEEQAEMQALVGEMTTPEDKAMELIGRTYGDLALSIYSVNGSAWGQAHYPDRASIQKALRARLAKVGKLTDAGLRVIHEHYVWFAQRVTEATDVDALKNG